MNARQEVARLGACVGRACNPAATANGGNPLPEAGLVQVMERLQRSLQEHPRPLFIVYHNPLLERVVSNAGLTKVSGTHQFVVYSAQAPS